MPNPRMNIATALNSNYTKYTYVMLTSLFMNHTNFDIHVYLLNHDLTDSDRNTLSGLGKKFHQTIHFIDIDCNRFPNSLPVNASWTIEAYFRLMLPDILPEDVDRILYLDVDVIVDKSLNEFYFTDFDSSLFCVCRDMCVDFPFHDIRDELFKEHIKMGFTYFNSGVMLWNITAMRGIYSFDYYMNLIEKLNYKVLAPDQDLLNFAHFDQIKLMDEYRYDLFARMSYRAGVSYSDVKRETAIIHFTGQKPWKGDYLHYEIEKIWWDYAEQTPLYNDLLKDFVDDCIRNNSVYETVLQITKERDELSGKLNKSLEIIQTFMKEPQ